SLGATRLKSGCKVTSGTGSHKTIQEESGLLVSLTLRHFRGRMLLSFTRRCSSGLSPRLCPNELRVNHSPALLSSISAFPASDVSWKKMADLLGHYSKLHVLFTKGSIMPYIARTMPGYDGGRP
uniref:Uncharacterized protein n=1 Tax=Salvator merianae TaxID=96440 RepID=A0A8D0ECS2_SALMN